MGQLSVYDKIVDILKTDLEEKSVVIKWMAWRSKLIYEIVEKFWRDDCPTYAASLAYTTLLALAPLAAVSLSIYSSFEFSKEKILNFVFEKLLPNKEFARVIEQNIDTFSNNATSVSIYGVIALVIFSIWVMSVIEAAFNMIWKVERSRPIISQFVTYWSTVTFAPILIAISIIATAKIQGLVLSENWAEYSYLQGFIIKLIPYVLTWIAFLLIYRLVPNTDVHFRPALTGAIIAGTMFELAKYAFDYWVQNWATYTAVYGALAIIPMFLFWLYLTWLIVLLGSVIAYAMQYPKEIHHTQNEGFRTTNYLNYYVLRVLIEAARAFERGEGELSQKEVTNKLEITGEFYGDILRKLHKLGLIEFIDMADNRFLFKIAPSDIKITDTLLNLDGETFSVAPEPADDDSAIIDRFFRDIRKGINQSAGRVSISELSKMEMEESVSPQVVKLKKERVETA